MTKLSLVFTSLLTASTPQHVPNEALTPGMVDTRITTKDLCPHLRPGLRNVPTALKKMVCKSYGYTSCAGMEVDHKIPLECGGANDERNLWAQPMVEARVKDQEEDQWHRDVCAGRRTLSNCQDHFQHWPNFPEDK